MPNLTELAKELKEAEKATSDAWANFCWHRALLWSYHGFITLVQSYRALAAKGKLPSKEFINTFRAVREKVSDLVRLLPEYEVYKDCRAVEKETRLVYLTAKKT
jgi:hypothetical protein